MTLNRRRMMMAALASAADTTSAFAGDAGLIADISAGRMIADTLAMGGVLMEVEREPDEGPRVLEFAYWLDATGEEIEIDVDLDTGAPIDLDIERPDSDDAMEYARIVAALPASSVSFADAVQAVLAVADGVFDEVEWDLEYGRLVIEVTLDDAEYHVDPATGTILGIDDDDDDDQYDSHYDDDDRGYEHDDSDDDLDDDRDAARPVIKRTPRSGRGGGISSSADRAGNTVASFVNDDDGVVFLEWSPREGAWLATLFERSSGAPIRALDTDAFVDASKERAMVGVATPDGLLVVDPGADAATDRNLTRELPGATPIVARQTSFVSKDGLAFLAGMDPAGDLVLYFQTAETRADGESVWGFSNLSRDHLASAGLATPAFNQDLISYVTDWNGLTIAGLDARGDIQAVWWAPGMTRWTTSNLSSLTGAAPMATGLTAYLTPWGGINLAGLDAGGNVVVTWWVPRFGGEWAQTDLSDRFGHAGMGGMELTSYVTPWGGLNLAGIDDDGELVVYWWSPGMRDWAISPLSGLMGGAAVPKGELSASTTPDGLVNLFGVTDDGEVIRYHWQPGAAWNAENVGANTRGR